VIRKTWDGSRLENLVKQNPIKSTGHHVSIVGHITREDFERNANEVDFFNGMLNRWMLFLVRRSKELPDGGEVPENQTEPLIRETMQLLDAARRVSKMERTASARELWHSVYSELSAGGEGLHAAITSRGEAHVLRLSMIYALADGKSAVDDHHLQAALDLWAYSDASSKFLFGDRLGDPVADAIVDNLRLSGELVQTEISALFNRHLPAGVIGAALDRLHEAGIIEGFSEPTPGRPRRIWRLRSQCS
jgi:hypothetical protein